MQTTGWKDGHKWDRKRAIGQTDDDRRVWKEGQMGDREEREEGCSSSDLAADSIVRFGFTNSNRQCRWQKTPFFTLSHCPYTVYSK
jgi:hypothetical protein